MMDPLSSFAFNFNLCRYDKGTTKGVYNIGAHEERTVLSVATDICSRLGKAVQVDSIKPASKATGTNLEP